MYVQIKSFTWLAERVRVGWGWGGGGGFH